MDILNGFDVAKAGFVALMTFGSVSAVSFFIKDLDAKYNWLMSLGFALVYSFVPADMGNLIANKIKDGVVIATSLNGFYKMSQGIAKKVGE